MKTALAKRQAKETGTVEPEVIVVDGRASRKFMLQVAAASLRAAIEVIKAKIEEGAGVGPLPLPAALPLAATGTNNDVMTADEVASFLGVDRNTVYEYAGRGVIPHQRLGKRILFRRGALVTWLDASCKATSTRKG
ncbi:MAG TPA: helix-turn-helix domain-containing protein [Kofleriaceae bacterium]|nr:helix-turn-helix domain-containing protein [Kofleriaceae bacterium]